MRLTQEQRIEVVKAYLADPTEEAWKKLGQEFKNDFDYIEDVCKRFRLKRKDLHELIGLYREVMRHSHEQDREVISQLKQELVDLANDLGFTVKRWEMDTPNLYHQKARRAFNIDYIALTMKKIGE